MSITIATHENIRVITIDRPHRRNAVDLPTAQALYDAFNQFDQDDQVDVAILCGQGEHFCAGADLKALSHGENSQHRVKVSGAFAPMGPTRLILSKPVIAAIEGYAVAGGLELALWCDLRVAANEAILGVFCRRFGVPLIDLGTIRLPRLIGHSRAMDLILTGRPVAAKEAFEIGLVNRLSDTGDALNTAMALAQEISQFPQLCMRNDRLSTIYQWGLSEDAAAKMECQLGIDTLKSGETTKGAQSFHDGQGRHGHFSKTLDARKSGAPTDEP